MMIRQVLIITYAEMQCDGSIIIVHMLGFLSDSDLGFSELDEFINEFLLVLEVFIGLELAKEFYIIYIAF